MSATREQRIHANCAIIWGQGDYDISIETDDWVYYQAWVREDLGTSYGPPLTGTGLCNSSEEASRELDRMLSVWVRHKQTGQPMTKAKLVEVFGGPRGRNKAIVETFCTVIEEREQRLLPRRA